MEPAVRSYVSISAQDSSPVCLWPSEYMLLTLQDPGICGVTGFFYHIPQNCTPKCKLPTQSKDKAPRGEAARTHLLRCRISKCSITSMLPPPGASRTLMGLGTFTVPVLRMAIKLATSPSNILLACQRNNKGGEEG